MESRSIGGRPDLKILPASTAGYFTGINDWVTSEGELEAEWMKKKRGRRASPATAKGFPRGQTLAFTRLPTAMLIPFGNHDPDFRSW
jgi:hypothetical protein